MVAPRAHVVVTMVVGAPRGTRGASRARRYEQICSGRARGPIAQCSRILYSSAPPLSSHTGLETRGRPCGALDQSV